MAAIKVQNIGKSYKIFHSKWAKLYNWFFPSHKNYDEKWALKNISFEVKQGDAVGLIGVNGAGKSTLLKIITGTTIPSEGSVDICGHVVALLELGMGFHPEFTGRENVMMSGLMSGLTTEELTSLMPEIIEFAEIGDYIDQPVRVYSSGMQMRLAFSVATVKQPDILIVDEALSVGDIYFQHKSFERIRQYRALGTTLLFVSHDKEAVQSVCDKAILLDHGGIKYEGKPNEVMDFYNALLSDNTQNTITQSLTDTGTRTLSGSGEVRIVDARLEDASHQPIEVITVGQRVILSVLTKVVNPVDELVLGFMIKDRLGQAVYGINTHSLEKTFFDLKANESVKYEVEFATNLGEGSYSITLALHTSSSHIEKNYEWRDLAVMFNVINVSHPNFIGVSWLNPEIRCTRE
jgi:lipopolysaccharide transport system ATP-binding protein